jgi:hypothetical protein
MKCYSKPSAAFTIIKGGPTTKLFDPMLISIKCYSKPSAACTIITRSSSNKEDASRRTQVASTKEK